MDQNTHDRHYSEEELAAIIKRATEIHEESKSDTGSKLSLSELEVIADDLGIPKAHLRRAASELQLGSRRVKENKFRLFGGPKEREHNWTLDRVLTDDDWERIVLEMRASTGKSGKTEEIGRAREWSYSLEDGGITLLKTMVHARSEDGKTDIKVKKSYTGKAIVSYMLGILPAVLLFSLIQVEGWGEGIGGAAGLALVILMAAVAFMSGRGILSRVAKGKEDEVRILSADLQDALIKSDHGKREEKSFVPELEIEEIGEREVNLSSRDQRVKE